MLSEFGFVSSWVEQCIHSSGGSHLGRDTSLGYRISLLGSKIKKFIAMERLAATLLAMQRFSAICSGSPLYFIC